MSDPVAQYAAAARAFCAWVEGEPDDPLADLAIAHGHLAGLYALALGLPKQGRPPSQSGAYPAQDDQLRDHAARRFHGLPLLRYGRVLAPCAPGPHHADIGSLPEDLFDTYRDVKRGLQYFDGGDQASAQFHWRFTWCMGWGGHAASALSAIHAYRSDMEYRGEG